jgi:PAS domain S-box-containing protein
LSAQQNSKTPLLTISAWLTISILLLSMTGSIWTYLKGSQSLQTQARVPTGMGIARTTTEEAVSSLFSQLDSYFKELALSTGIGAVSMVFAMGLIFSLWRRVWMSRALQSIKKLEDLHDQLDHTRTDAQRHRLERARLEEQLRQTYEEMDKRVDERTANLARTCSSLEKELNSRKLAEKALTFQAKELERSKDVLEMHVQARTKELQKLKSRYELILNSAGEGIYGLDLQGKTTFVNPAAAKLTGWTIEEMIGKAEHEVFYGLPHPLAADEENVKKDENGNHLGEQVFQRKGGSEFPVEYVRTSITENDRLFGAVVIFKDITERKRTEDALARKAAELSRSNAELEQFAYVASHDMQEPLRKIQAFGDRLKSKCHETLPEDGRDYLERMLSAAARMQTLINDLLTFSRIISTSQPFVAVDLSQITREVLGDLEVRIEQTQAQIEVGELPTIEADPTQMRQLLQNLIGNALKFHAPNRPPCVQIKAQIQRVPFTGGDGDPEQTRCLLDIQDNGIGFEDRYVDKIFAVFQRLHGRSEYEGTGVGLAVCRRIIDRHGGTIVARGKPGEGACFTITLPVQQALRNPPP